MYDYLPRYELWTSLGRPQYGTTHVPPDYPYIDVDILTARHGSSSVPALDRRGEYTYDPDAYG